MAKLSTSSPELKRFKGGLYSSSRNSVVKEGRHSCVLIMPYFWNAPYISPYAKWYKASTPLCLHSATDWYITSSRSCIYIQEVIRQDNWHVMYTMLLLNMVNYRSKVETADIIWEPNCWFNLGLFFEILFFSVAITTCVFRSSNIYK